MAGAVKTDDVSRIPRIVREIRVRTDVVPEMAAAGTTGSEEGEGRRP